jgi:hypothetical protein
MRISTLTFPDISLATANSYTLRVRGIRPNGIFSPGKTIQRTDYPAYFTIAIPPAESDPRITDQPWRNVRFTALLTYPDAPAVIYRQEYDLSRHQGRSGAPTNSPVDREIWLRFGNPAEDIRSSWPLLSGYDIHIRVSSPSLRSSDKLTIDAIPTRQHHWEPAQ